jgi:hypothetical protein
VNLSPLPSVTNPSLEVRILKTAKIKLVFVFQPLLAGAIDITSRSPKNVKPG